MDSFQPLALSSTSDESAIVNTVIAMSALSIFGCVATTILVFFLKNTTSLYKALILAICLSNLIFEISNILLVLLAVSSDRACQIIVFWEFFGFFSGIAWTCSFTHFLLRSLINSATLNTFAPKYVLISLVLPIGLSIGLALSAHIDKSNTPGICWHGVQRDGHDSSGMMGFDLPSILASLYCCVTYFSIVNERRSVPPEKRFALSSYPLILAFSVVPWIAFDFYARIIQPNRPTGWISVICIIIWNSQGLLNTLALCFSVNLRECCKSICEKQSQDIYQERGSEYDSLTVGHTKIVKKTIL